jgi:UDP-N-acetylmuramyl pentapeptide synthase
VTIQETKGLFSRNAKTIGVTVELGENRYILQIVNGRLQASIAMVVRGVTLNTKSIDPADWFVRLAEETKKASEHAKSLSQSIANFMAT